MTALSHDVLALDHWLSALVPLAATARTLGINAALAATRHGAAGQPFGVLATQLADVTAELQLVGTEVRDRFGAVSRRLAAMSRNELRLRMLARADVLAEGQVPELRAAQSDVDDELRSTRSELRRELSSLVSRVGNLRSDAEVIMAGLGVSARIEAVRLGEDVVASAEAIQALVDEVRAVVDQAHAVASSLLPKLADIEARSDAPRHRPIPATAGR